MKQLVLLAVVCVCLGGTALEGDQSLRLDVSPAMAAAPAFVRVRAAIEASDANRALEIVAQSADFFRSSRIDLDGTHAARTEVFEFPNLPAGVYEISGVLLRTDGRRAAIPRTVRVVWMGGSR
jgi:hypothetical protein